MTREATINPELTGAARAVNTLAIALSRHDQRDAQTMDESPLAAWVAPHDLLTNRAVPLPHRVRSRLEAGADNLVDATYRP